MALETERYKPVAQKVHSLKGIDYDHAEKIFVMSDDLTYEKIAVMFGVAKTTMMRAAQKMRWKEKRRSRQLQDEADILGETRKDLKAQVATRIEEHLTVIRKLQEQCFRVIFEGQKVLRKDGSMVIEPLAFQNGEGAIKILLELQKSERFILGESGERIEVKNAEPDHDYSHLSPSELEKLAGIAGSIGPDGVAVSGS